MWDLVSLISRFHLTFIPTCWLPSPALVMARGALASILPGSIASKKSFSSPVADSCVPVAALIRPIQIIGPSRSIPVGQDVMQTGQSWVLGPKAGLEVDISHEPLGLILGEEGSPKGNWGCVSRSGDMLTGRHSKCLYT